ncbi:LOW QUALITY PROTEIN: hypothetical protein V2J09_012283 [Rumex salicifolius]
MPGSVDLTKPLKGTIRIEGVKYFLDYEGLNLICHKCGRYGHVITQCPQINAEQKVGEVVEVEDINGAARKSNEAQ